MSKSIRHGDTINIAPVGLMNAALRRQGIRLEIVLDDDLKTGVCPTQDDETVEMQVGDLVNRLVLLDQSLGFVAQSNVDKLKAKVSDLRDLFKNDEIQTLDDLGPDFGASITDDELDDLIAELEQCAFRLGEIVKDSQATP